MRIIGKQVQKVNFFLMIPQITFDFTYRIFGAGIKPKQLVQTDTYISNKLEVVVNPKNNYITQVYVITLFKHRIPIARLSKEMRHEIRRIIERELCCVK